MENQKDGPDAPPTCGPEWQPIETAPKASMGSEGREELLATLLAEGLDLCAASRRLEERFLQTTRNGGTRSGTLHLWAIEYHEKALADWERRSAVALGLLPHPGEPQ